MLALHRLHRVGDDVDTVWAALVGFDLDAGQRPWLFEVVPASADLAESFGH